MSLSPWRRKQPPCEGHGGATPPPSASSWALFPPAYPAAYASPPFDRSCPAPPSHTLLDPSLAWPSCFVCLICARVGHQSDGFVTRVFYPPTFQIIKTWDSGVLQAAPRERAGRKKIRGIHHQVENTHTKKRIETHSGSEGGCSKVVTTKNTP